MANKCFGCKWQTDIVKSDNIPHACIKCHATYRGPSNYTRPDRKK